MSDFAQAAAAAPNAPGVYLFLGPRRTLVYVGKAASLRRRLLQHARGRDARLRAVYHLVRDVAWEQLPDEDAAAAREADLILALRPAFNASLTDDARWTYIVVSDVSDGLRFTLSRDPCPGGGRAYGCFPHLGIGVHSPPAIACSDGYPALLRLLWATGTAASGGRFPSSVRGESPPDLFEAPVAPSLHRPLNAFLAGTSDRLTGELERLVSSCDAYLQPALRRDCVAAAPLLHVRPTRDP